MTKYKDLKQEEKEFVDFYQMKWIRIIGFLAFLGLGVWMLIDPTLQDIKVLNVQR